MNVTMLYSTAVTAVPIIGMVTTEEADSISPMAASRKPFVSDSVMFMNPTTRPRTANTQNIQGSAIRSPATTQITNPTINAHFPMFRHASLLQKRFFDQWSGRHHTAEFGKFYQKKRRRAMPGGFPALPFPIAS